MALNTCEMWSNGNKIAFFSKKYEKLPSGCGLCPQTLVCDTFELQYTCLLKHVSQFTHFRTLSIGLSPLLEGVPSCESTPGHGFWSSFCDIFASTKNFSFEVSDDVIACDLWFEPPQSNILATPINVYVRYDTLELHQFVQHGGLIR